jgi:phospholipid/cholesterol/gamma-HCH transport system substrate-binding protein
MMRSRTIREGSVGLLALLGVFLFGAFIIWLRGVNFTRKGYEIVAEFPDVYGIQIGASVRYRGVEVGRVSKIEASSNRVGVVMEIASTELIMPHQIAIFTNRSGLIGESFIDIIPQTNLSANAESMSPVSSDCNSDLIVCQGDRLQGETSVTFEQLLPSLLELSNTYGDPKFIEKLSNTLQNTSQAALEASRLSKELTILSSSIRGEIILCSPLPIALPTKLKI